MIAYEEVSDTGISPENYTVVQQATGDFLKQIVIHRQNPSFSVHDTDSRDNGFYFSAAGNDICIVRAWIQGGTLYVQQLLAEQNDPTQLNAWSTPVSMGAALINLPPKVLWTGAEWRLYWITDTGTIHKTTSAEGNTWTDTGVFGTVTLPIDGTIEQFTAVDEVETVYVVKRRSDKARAIFAYTATAPIELPVYWAFEMSGFDVTYRLDASDDPTSLHPDSDVRHIITFSSEGPATYTIKDTGSTPTKEREPSGGLWSLIIRPQTSERPVQCSKIYAVQVFDQWSTIKFRAHPFLTTAPSIHGTNAHDTLWVTAFGADGDWNTGDTSSYYTSMYYYSSRDGKFWSQDQLIPTEDLVTTTEIQAVGFQLAVCGNYVYLVSPKYCLRSLGCLDFNNPHPHWSLDLTNRVLSYASSWSDARQTSLTLDNRDGFYNNTFITQGGTLSLTTKFGKRVSNTNYLFQIAIEEVDSVSPERERPREVLQLQARDRTAWLTDRSQSQDAHQYDNTTVGHDDFHDIAGIENAGLSHTAAVSGSWGTGDNKLKVKSKWANAVAFDTHKNAVANGVAQAYFNIPDPAAHGGDESTAPAYAGVVFRAVDKDNYWYCRYDAWKQKAQLGMRLNGVDSTIVSWSPSATFKANVIGGGIAGLRVDFRYNYVKVYESILTGNWITLSSYTVPGEDGATKPLLIGYVGKLGCGYSDEDSSEEEPQPISLIDITVPTPISVWGPVDSYEPTQLLAITGNAALHQCTNIKSGSWGHVEKTPPAGILTSLGGQVIDAYPDSWDFNRSLLLGLTGVATITDSWGTSPTWEYKAATAPQSGFMTGHYDGAQYIRGNIVTSINAQGYYGWLEWRMQSQWSTDNRELYYVYTTDNFATIHRTYVTMVAYTAYGWAIPTVQISQYATAWNNIHVFVGGGQYIQKSLNGGQSFAATTLDLAEWPFYLPYTKPGGAPNTSDEGIVRARPGYGGMQIKRDAITAYLTGGNEDAGRQRRFIGGLTVDSNYLWITTTNYQYYSPDGGATWTRMYISLNLGEANNGWPTTPNFIVGFGVGGSGVRVTYDRNMSGSNSYGMNMGYAVAGAWADLSQVYTQEQIHG